MLAASTILYLYRHLYLWVLEKKTTENIKENISPPQKYHPENIKFFSLQKQKESVLNKALPLTGVVGQDGTPGKKLEGVVGVTKNRCSILRSHNACLIASSKHFTTSSKSNRPDSQILN